MHLTGEVIQPLRNDYLHTRARRILTIVLAYVHSLFLESSALINLPNFGTVRRSFPLIKSMVSGGHFRWRIHRKYLHLFGSLVGHYSLFKGCFIRRFTLRRLVPSQHNLSSQVRGQGTRSSEYSSDFVCAFNSTHPHRLLLCIPSPL